MSPDRAIRKFENESVASAATLYYKNLPAVIKSADSTASPTSKIAKKLRKTCFCVFSKDSFDNQLRAFTQLADEDPVSEQMQSFAAAWIQNAVAHALPVGIPPLKAQKGKQYFVFAIIFFSC